MFSLQGFCAYSPVGINKARVDVNVLADACLIFSAPPARSFSAHIVKGARKMVNSFEANHCGDLFQRISRVLDEMLRFLNTVLQQVTPRRHAQRVFEVLPDMTIRAANYLGDIEQAKISGVMIADKLRRLLHDPVTYSFMIERFNRAGLLTASAGAQMQQQQFHQECAAKLPVILPLALSLVADAFEQIGNARLAVRDQFRRAGQMLTEPAIFHQEFDIKRLDQRHGIQRMHAARLYEYKRASTNAMIAPRQRDAGRAGH